jgi:hypothetical protein
MPNHPELETAIHAAGFRFDFDASQWYDKHNIPIGYSELMALVPGYNADEFASAMEDYEERLGQAAKNP